MSYYDKYEYIIVPVDLAVKETTEVKLNSLGRSGWELVHIDVATGNAILKRRHHEEELLKG